MPDDTTPQQTERHLSIPLELERAAADAEASAIPVSFASDNIVVDPLIGPVQLSMEPGAVDLTLAAERGLPVHEMHHRAIPVGRVTDISLESGRLRGLMRFSASARGQELYRDARDGILTDTSVGAAVYAIREESDHVVAVSWRPREVSLVDEGADHSVGINRFTQETLDQFAQALGADPQRAFERLQRGKQAIADPTISTSPATVPETLQQPPSEAPTMPAETQQQDIAEVTRSAASDTTAANRDEINIRELGDYAHKRAPELGIDRMRDDFIAFQKPFEEFRGEVWRQLQERNDAQPAVSNPTELGLNRTEAKEFSIVRAAYAHLTGNWKKAGFELECSRAVADKLGREARGFFVPLDVQRNMTLERTMSAGEAAAGGYLVGESHRADMFIESLRARSIGMQAGVRMLTGLVGNVSIPKLTGNATFYWLSEDEDVTTSDPSLGQILMSPRTVAGAVPMTRRLLMQSSPDVERMVREDLITGAALAMDEAIFEGDGAKEPLGIFNHGDINTQAVSDDDIPTWLEIIGFESAVATDNALMGSLRYVTTPTIRGNMKGTSKDTGSGQFLCSENNTVNGYPLLTSTQLATDRIGFGDFSQIIVGMWGVLDVKPDEATKAASGGLVLRVFQDADIGIRHAEAFCKDT